MGEYDRKIGYANKQTAALEYRCGAVWVKPEHIDSFIFDIFLRRPSPLHAVGDYYFAFRHARGAERWAYLAQRLRRETCNRFYAKRPWRIPAKAISELRALGMAIRLQR